MRELIRVLSLAKLIGTVSGGFRREQMIETVTRLGDLPKKFAIKGVNKRINVKGGICDAPALCLSG